MALTGTIKPFGLRDIKLVSIPGGTQVDLPYGMTMTFKEVLTSGELRGDDATQAIVAITDKLEWELEAGGISLEAWAVLTGRSITLTGSGAAEINTMTGAAGDIYPYFRLYGQSVGDGADDVHILVYKAKCTGAIEGEFKDGEFWVTKASGVAVDDGSNGVYDIVQNETSTALPSS
jgi:hypothetical protein